DPRVEPRRRDGRLDPVTRCADCNEPITASLWVAAHGPICLLCHWRRTHADDARVEGRREHDERR
ncbi:hypothetical protein, partial [Mycobacterium sp.]|uniref:hypothetical protein n=1 Tax=Mycobacterium sp. TaxID=1785 RepID=UPI002B70EC99